MSWLRIDDAFEDHPKVDTLSDAAHRLWMRAACWCRKPTNAHTFGFVPRGKLRAIAKNSASQAQLEKLAQELVDANGDGMFEHGLWEPEEGGWRFHDWAQYQPEDDEERIKAKRSEAGRKGAAARWAKQPAANAAPSDTAPSKPNGTAHGTASFANGKPMAKNAPDPVPDPRSEDPTSQPDPRPDNQRAPGQRPVVRAGLLDAKIQAKNWDIPEAFDAYARELGLNENQHADAVADFREKISRPGEPPWLASQLCRFLEQKAGKVSQRQAEASEATSYIVDDQGRVLS